MNRQVAHIETLAVTEAGMVLARTAVQSPYKVRDKLGTKNGQRQIQLPFQDLAPGWKQLSPDNQCFMFC